MLWMRCLHLVLIRAVAPSPEARDLLVASSSRLHPHRIWNTLSSKLSRLPRQSSSVMQSSGVVGIPEFYSGYANFQYRLWFIWRRLDGLVDVDQIGWSGMISSCPWLWEDEASADEECIKVFAEGLSLLPHIPPLEWVNACQTLQVRLPRTRSPPHPLAPLTSQTRLPFIAWLMVAESPRMDDNPKRIEHLILDWAQLIAIPEKASPCHFCRISHILPVWIRTMRQICELDQFRSIPWTHKCNCWKSCLTAAQEHSVPTQMSLSKDSVAFHALYELVVPLWPLVCWVLYRTIMDDGRVEAFLDILRTPDRDLLEWDDNDEHYLSQMKASDKHRLFAEWIQYMVEIDLSGWARIRTATYTEDRRLDLDCQIDFLDDTHTRLVAFTRKHISTWNDFEGIRIAVENMINTLLSPLKIGFDIGAFFPTADDDEGPTPADFESKEFWVLPNFGRPPTDNKIMFASIWNTPDTSVLMRVRYMDMVQRLDPSFQNLGAYTYFHMVRQPTLGLPIETLRRLESHFWPEYDENCARSNRYFLTRCSSELDGLFAFLKQLDKTSKTNHAISKEIYESINRDIPGIVVKVVGALREQDLCDEIMESRGSQAHELLNLLQALLDLEPFSAVKPMIWKTLVRLSRASSLHPGCFPITGLQRVGQVVAGGGFGDIQKGLVNGQSVSIKIMRIFQDTGVEAALKDFSQEALIWRQLSHPNLLPFYGLYYLEDRLCLVSPWMEHGNIMDFLAKKPPNIHRVSLILDVALGLEYLHKKKVIHGDLKAINILVTPSRRACICDFGLSSIVNEITLRLVHSTTTAPKGTPRYYAPELLQSNAKKHFASDTYAFACVCYEILTGHVPFHTERNEIFVMLQILQGKRPQQTASCAGTAKLDDLWELLQSCWQEIPEMRPTAAQIVERLKGPSIGAITTTSTTDWDEELTCKFRRSLQQRPLLPSVNQIERLIFGDEAAQGCPECLLDREFPEWQEKKAPKRRYKELEGRGGGVSTAVVPETGISDILLDSWVDFDSEEDDRLLKTLLLSGVTQRDEHISFSGAYGDVFKASYQGKPVALKRMRIFQDTNQRDIRRSFCREALVWQRLRNFYIVPLIGIDAEGFPPFPCLVSPWMKNGTVLKYLSTLGDHGRQHTVTRLIREIAQGLAYLHDEHVVHGDLRGANILVDDAGRARLKDFGFGGGCVRWMAPETLDPDAFGVQNHPRQPASDIYAFGCVCLELYTGYPPFHDAHVREPVVIYQVVKGVRPNRPAGNIIPDYIWNIMQKCWAQNFADRPSILGILLERGMHDQP